MMIIPRTASNWTQMFYGSGPYILPRDPRDPLEQSLEAPCYYYHYYYYYVSPEFDAEPLRKDSHAT